ncbi:syntaxin-binding protein 5-like isoform X2 [Anneissia japonica]|uniref:syntaxin-binding protein 5-like isoform X2 n=1 Tax=Anneissia japonica TaxID=1529436 RepID=UPI001425617F|nr:syntaxin-binding protein 5-like isoform X2 [Anneissia japonica]
MMTTKYLKKKINEFTQGGTSSSSAKLDTEISESLHPNHFTVCKVVRHGFPYEPTAMAYDPVQNILAIGTKNGSLRIFGQPGVDCHERHDSDVAIIQIMFLINEGALVTVCADNSLNMWNLRQKRPAILHSLKFNKEIITYCHIPFQSKWFYIGTERGNIHIANIESFTLSGYVINWNKAIELSRKTLPGPVIHLSDCPTDQNKLLIGFESGTAVIWDLRIKAAENRFNGAQPIRSICWHFEGRQFMCSHTDGSLTCWDIKSPSKPVSVTYPHGKVAVKGGKPVDPCAPIMKVEWKSAKLGDPYVVFSGGLCQEKGGVGTPCVTIIQGKNTTVLEMEYPVIDFVSLCETPWPSAENQDPYAILVLLNNDLVVVDLTSPGYPCFENPYPMDLHESPVTCVQYFADCPADLIPALYSAGSNSSRKKTNYSKKNWPIKGGQWGTGGSSDQEIIITGHADGSLKFWDASQVTLQVLYKLKTAKVFERGKQHKSLDGEEEPYAIQKVTMCPESRILLVAGASGHVLLYRFSKLEASCEIMTLEVSIIYEVEDPDTPETELPPMPPNSLKRNTSTLSADSTGSLTTNSVPPPAPPSPNPSTGAHKPSTSSGEGMRDGVPNLRVKSSPQKYTMGFQPDLCCQLLWTEGEPPPLVTCLQINSFYGLVAFGTVNGLVIVDYIQKTCLLHMGTPNLYGSADPYQRTPRSPKKPKVPQSLGDIVEQLTDNERSRQASGATAAAEQPNGICVSPTGNNAKKMKSVTDGKLTRSKSQTSRRVTKTQSNPCDAGANGDKDKDGADSSGGGGGGGIFSGLLSQSRSTFSFFGSQDRSESSFTQSRSSSMSSLDRESKEGVQSLYFVESYARKTDSLTSPCLWVGTTLGSTLVIVLTLPPPGDQRISQPVIVSPSGTVLCMKGTILNIAFLNSNGGLITASTEAWKDMNYEQKEGEREKKKPVIQQRSRMSPSASTEMADRQFAIITSEKEAKVISLSSQTCAYRAKIAESSYVVVADVISMPNKELCLACYVANGHVMIYSLPSLRILLDCDFVPLTDLRVGRTFQFSAHGKALYQCSPTEIQRLTVCAEHSNSLHDMLGDLFIPCTTPEAPSRGFFKNLFSVSSGSLDRQELFGENSGKPSRSIAKHVPGSAGMEAVKAQSATVGGEIARTKLELIKRGEKLSETEKRTADMMQNAESFAMAASELMKKQKNKKWYQL